MAGWTRHEGVAVALPFENIDTDQLIPARFMSTPRAAGYGGFLLHDLAAGAPDFPLNRHPDATVLIARRNFGSGSSREAAVYALVDFGICAVIAPGFGDIFAGNAVNNGLLPVRLGADEVEKLIAALDGGAAPVAVDLPAGQVTLRPPGAAVLSFGFELGEVARRKLVRGWDDIDLTADLSERIDAFAADRRQRLPWAWPTGT